MSEHELTPEGCRSVLRQSAALAGIGVFVVDLATGRCLYCSEPLARLHGLPVERCAALLGGEAHLERIHPDDRARYRAALAGAGEETRHYQVEYRMHDAAGTLLHLREMAEQVVEAGAVRLIGCVQDVSEAKRIAATLERRVAERTAELRAANRELEAFSYSVSHDLRAPLRAITGFSRILLEDYAPQLPDEAQHYLKIVDNGGQHMGQLIDDLLTFSRLGRMELRKQPVATADLVRQVLADLQAEQSGRQVEITLGDLPPCRAEPSLLRQVFVNLLHNALKYSRNREVARIEVGCRECDGEQVYFVKDNGVGFDMQYAQKLFGVFQRLHRAEEYEGTGVGLAIVQRIVDRHGGRVWAEAALDQGATFYFTLKGGPPRA
jgi:signal transduction histidine kinase